MEIFINNKTAPLVHYYNRLLSALEVHPCLQQFHNSLPPLIINNLFIAIRMDPLTVTTGVIACLQTTCSILTWCYGIRADMKAIPLTLIEIINEVRDLRNVIETIESAWSKCDRSEKNDLGPTQNLLGLSSVISPIIANCLSELQDLENRVRPEQVHTLLGSRRKVLLQSLIWRLKGNEAKEYITRLQRCKAALTLAITSDTSYVQQDNRRRM
jgi:uncharacterized membrane protein YfbV (UPF0208 family)